MHVCARTCLCSHASVVDFSYTSCDPREDTAGVNGDTMFGDPIKEATFRGRQNTSRQEASSVDVCNLKIKM